MAGLLVELPEDGLAAPEIETVAAPALQGEQFLARLRIDDDDFPELASSELCPDTGFKAD